MADRFPLIVDSSNQNIKELPTGDHIILFDNEKIKVGTNGDLSMYHDGTNSYLNNTTGILKIATEISGIAVTIGHTTSETTVADNLTITGVATASTSSNITQVALTSSSNAVAWDAAAAANAYHLTTENTTFSAPSNAVEGAIISVEIAHGGTPYTVAWNTVFEFAASTAPVVTATANKTDIFAFRYNGSVWQEIGRVQNMAQT
jgi:hypothetical protein